MRLKSFRVFNYRSISDSGEILVSKITAMLGRNESGKSNLLRALFSLNPHDGRTDYNPIKDFPRWRKLEECTKETEVIRSLWSLSESEKSSLSEILPRARNVKEVTISRRYKSTVLRIRLKGLEEIEYDPKSIKATLRKIVPSLNVLEDSLDEGQKPNFQKIIENFAIEAEPVENSKDWANKFSAASQVIRKEVAKLGKDWDDSGEAKLAELEVFANLIREDETAYGKALNYVSNCVPVFIYLDEYPSLQGHQNIDEYVRKKNSGQISEAEKNFEKLCSVAGLDPQNLHSLNNSGDHETRNQLANRASAAVTGEIKRLWKDRKLKIRFNLDSNHMDTLLSDPNASYDVEVNLDERSRGFQWFFSFYITFAADTKGFDEDEAILLLDEPGLYLHARSQADLLAHFKTDFKNMIIYTTHSPFMVPTHDLNSIRTVNIDEQNGTTVTNDPSGDSRTLFPLQAALGYDLAQSLFVGPNNLVVEGVTDFWIISSISSFLADKNEDCLNPEITITPAGGAQKVSYMVTLLSSEQLNVVVLLDHEKMTLSTKDDLLKSKLIKESNILFVSEVLTENSGNEADIEDLLDSKVYENLVKQSYKQELKGKNLKLNSNIPRIAKRFEEAFKQIGLEFHKTRPARLLLNTMATEPDQILTADSKKHFQTLFQGINKRFELSKQKELVSSRQQ